MQSEKSQLEGERIMPETRFAEFPASTVDPRVVISRSASETNVTHDTKNYYLSFVLNSVFDILHCTSQNDLF